MRSCIAPAAFIGLATVFAAQSANADVIFSDDTFANSSWAIENVLQGVGASATAAQSSGGNPGTARRVTLATGSAFGDSTSSFQRFGTSTATRYEPATQGAIVSIDWSIEARFVTGSFFGAGQGIAFALKQGTVIYFADYTTTGSSGAWIENSASGLTAANFSRLDGATGTPDFSTAGAPIRFGFLASNSNGGGAFTTTVDYDNWFVRVVVPSPTTGAAFAGFAVASLVRRRRSTHA